MNDKPGPEFNIGPWRHHLPWVPALFGIFHLFQSQRPPTTEPGYAVSNSRFKSLVEDGRVEWVPLEEIEALQRDHIEQRLGSAERK